MEGLSNDILELILRQLENTSEMEKCLKTCLKWRHIIDWISENLISCPFDGCSVKVTKIRWKDMEDHKSIHDPEFQRLFTIGFCTLTTPSKSKNKFEKSNYSLIVYGLYSL